MTEPAARLTIETAEAAAPDLARLYVAAEVQRWHQNPAMAREGQTDADHIGRGLQLLLALNPGASRDLIGAWTFHDVGELEAGDWSGPAKRANPKEAAAMAAIEARCRQRICGPDPVLDVADMGWITLIDCLEPMCFVLLRCPREYQRLMSGWGLQESSVTNLADRLGVGSQVRGLLADLKGGVW